VPLPLLLVRLLGTLTSICALLGTALAQYPNGCDWMSLGVLAYRLFISADFPDRGTAPSCVHCASHPDGKLGRVALTTSWTEQVSWPAGCLLRSEALPHARRHGSLLSVSPLVDMAVRHSALAADLTPKALWTALACASQQGAGTCDRSGWPAWPGVARWTASQRLLVALKAFGRGTLHQQLCAR